jgi:hypothetical protein
MERRVAQKTRQLNQEVKLLQSTLKQSATTSGSAGRHFLRSTASTPVLAKTPSPRSLRPRADLLLASVSSLRKKAALTPASRGSEAKSPRRSLVAIQKKPIMTRSKKARVLQLKK